MRQNCRRKRAFFKWTVKNSWSKSLWKSGKLSFVQTFRRSRKNRFFGTCRKTSWRLQHFNQRFIVKKRFWKRPVYPPRCKELSGQWQIDFCIKRDFFVIDFSAKFLKKSEVRFILLIFPFVLCGCRNLQKSSLSFQAMNTFVSVQTFGENSKNINQKIKARLSELESLFSTTDSSSEIYKLNHSSEKIQVSSETYSLLYLGW